MSKMITCIYCKQAQPPSREHVLQKGLGGNLTKKNVCEKCNSGFSPIDKALQENSFVAFDRVFEQTADQARIKLGGDHYYTPSDNDETLEIDIGFKLNGKIKPQILFKKDDPSFQIFYNVSCEDDFLIMINKLKEWRDNGKLAQIKTWPSPENEPKYTWPRIVLHEGNYFYFRLPQECTEKPTIIEEFRRFLSTNLEKIERQRGNQLKNTQVATDHTPSIRSKMVYSLSIYRAIAKIAFNLLAEKEGSTFVLKENFDPIRNYICGTQPGDLKDFVKIIPFENKFYKWNLEEQTHSVMIFYSKPVLSALVELFKRHRFLVNLGEIQHSDDFFHCHSFNYVKKTNKVVSFEDIVRSCFGEQ